MNGLNIEQVVENIYNIAKTKNIKIKDIEFQIGVSTGYLSRLLKPGGTRMSADVLVKLADVLGVSVDRLLNFGQKAEFNANERKMMAFIDKLCEDTQDANIGWTRITKDKFEYENREYDSKDMRTHVLAKCINSKTGVDENKNYYITKQFVYNSSYLDTYIEFEMYVFGVFEVRISNQYKAVISKVQFDNHYELVTCYELRMVDRATDSFGNFTDVDLGVKEICSAKENTDEMFSKPLKKLYDIVEEASNHVKLDEGISNAIDSYLNPSEQIPF